jgi:hypothetical protein
MSQPSTGSGGSGQQPADPDATVLLPGGQPFQPAPQQEQYPPQQDYGHQHAQQRPQYPPQQDYGHQHAQQRPQYPPQQDYGHQHHVPQQGYDQPQYHRPSYDQHQYAQQQQYPQYQPGAADAGQPAKRHQVGGAAKAIAGLVLLAAIVVGIGSVTTWVDAGIFTRTGLDDADGVITLPLAIIAAGFASARLFGRLPTTAAIVALVVGLLLSLIGFIDSADVSDAGVDVGYGLWMVLVGGIAMVLISIAGLIKRR